MSRPVSVLFPYDFWLQLVACLLGWCVCVYVCVVLFGIKQFSIPSSVTIIMLTRGTRARAYCLNIEYPNSRHYFTLIIWLFDSNNCKCACACACLCPMMIYIWLFWTAGQDPVVKHRKTTAHRIANRIFSRVFDGLPSSSVICFFFVILCLVRPFFWLLFSPDYCRCHVAKLYRHVFVHNAEKSHLATKWSAGKTGSFSSIVLQIHHLWPMENHMVYFFLIHF